MQKYTKDTINFRKKHFTAPLNKKRSLFFTNMLGEFNPLVMLVSMRHRILSPLRALRHLSFIFETKKMNKKTRKTNLPPTSPESFKQLYGTKIIKQKPRTYVVKLRKGF